MESSLEKPVAHISASIPERFRTALVDLLTAADYALDSGVDGWQFAIALAELLSGGAMLADIRWLVLREFAIHAKETTIPGDPLRSFRALPPTAFPPDTCLVLSPRGVAAIRAALENVAAAFPTSKIDNPATGLAAAPSEAATQVAAEPLITPEWDAAHRELRFGRHVVKRYRVPALNQELVLQVFHEEGWPEFIDDPLPPVGEQAPKHRLLATIKSLNRSQLTPVIRFHGNGNGLQIHWKAVPLD